MIMQARIKAGWISEDDVPTAQDAEAGADEATA
jgi:hypothetical protein